MLVIEVVRVFGLCAAAHFVYINILFHFVFLSMKNSRITGDVLREVDGIPPAIPLIYEHVLSRAYGDYKSV